MSTIQVSNYVTEEESEENKEGNHNESLSDDSRYISPKL